MNKSGTKNSGMHPLEGQQHPEMSGSDSLRFGLRRLQRDREPAVDLWPGIAMRLSPRGAKASDPLEGQPTAPVAAIPTGRAVPDITRRSRRWPVLLALAATVVLAVGGMGWLPQAPRDAAPASSLVQDEAAGMSRQYGTALAELGKVADPASWQALQPVFDDLDRNAGLILAALQHDPDSVLLLQQLRRTYSRHLALARRTITR